MSLISAMTVTGMSTDAWLSSKSVTFSGFELQVKQSYRIKLTQVKALILSIEFVSVQLIVQH